MNDLSIIYYTSNYLEEKNPEFLAHTKRYLIKAAAGLPIVAVSHRPCAFEYRNYHNIVMDGMERSHLNIYRQILIGAKAATTEWVAMAEDDIIYWPEHFVIEKYIKEPQPDVAYYDMNKVSIFTWIKPAMFSFRFKRPVINQMVINRKFLIECFEERFAWVDDQLKRGISESYVQKYIAEIGKYEPLVGLTPRKGRQESSKKPAIVYSHEYAYGYEMNQGKKKRLGDLRIIELDEIGRAADFMRLWNKDYEGA